MTTHETIDYRALNPDNCNIQDREFERAIDRFMSVRMPGFPLQLLERDYERWEIEPSHTYTVKREADDVTGPNGESNPYSVEDEYGDVHLFDCESEAEDFCDEQREEDEQGRLGFPWAWNWCHYPDEYITDEQLREAGFTIGLYTDSDGEQRRLCGIDGCGYSFQGAHFSKLYAIVSQSEPRTPVDTKDGPRLLTLPEGWDCN
jgi:hypothetical protein